MALQDERTMTFITEGGGSGGLGKGVNILHQSAKGQATEIQVKTRAKMIMNAVTDIPEWKGDPESWPDFSDEFLRLMNRAGYDIVCRPNYVTTAQT